ncbi:MAG: hypothetical protein DRP56_01375 [Planctomycetota bacterium]|nr:MAG: hypothetical protein DRP56_01375 [Planctomycetota bacterium]
MKKSTTLISTVMILIGLSVIGNASGEVTFSIAGSMSGGGSPISGVCLSPDENKLYAACWEDSPTSRVLEYNLSDYSLSQTIAFGSYHTHGDVVLSADGRYLFTPNYYYSDLSRIDLQSGNARQDLSVGTSWPGQVHITPDKTKVLVSAGRDGRSYDMNNDAVAVFNIQNGAFTKLATISLPNEPQCDRITYSPDGKYAYVTTYPRKSPQGILYEISIEGFYGITRQLIMPTIRMRAVERVSDKLYVSDTDNNKIWVVNKNTFSIESSIPLESSPGIIALHPNGKDLYILLKDISKLVVLDTSTNSIIGSFDQLYTQPHDIEFNNDGSKVFIPHSVGGILALDISASYLPIAIDIKPGSCPNPLNVKSKGVLPVAILGSEDFDIAMIDPVSLRLEGVAPIRSRIEDIAAPVAVLTDCACTTDGPDGFADLTLKFDRQEIIAALGEVEDGQEWLLYLTGALNDDRPIEGSDCVLIRKKGRPNSSGGGHTTLPDDFISYWSFDAGSGTTVADDSGNGHDGTINGATWTGGMSGSALSFVENDYVSLSNFGQPAAQTVTMWVKPYNVDNPHGYCWYGGYSNWAIFHVGTASGKFGFKIYDGADYWVYSDPVSNDTWYFLAASYGPEGMKLYVDGELVASNSYTGDGSSGGQNKYFGSQAGVSKFFDGEIDEARVWNRQLTLAEIQAVYQNL